MVYPFYRIDSSFVIKVADFGLSEDVYAHNYFRQQEISKDDSGEKSGVVKLPIRWMALESLHDGVFTEKTDVVYVFEIHVWNRPSVYRFGRGANPNPNYCPKCCLVLEGGGGGGGGGGRGANPNC